MLTPFTAFADTASTEYGVTDLCGLAYTLELAADATAYGTSIIAGAPPNIQVLTNDPLLKGTSVPLTISAVATLFPQDTPSQTMSFTVTIEDTCTTAVMSFATSPVAMSYGVTTAA